MAAEEMADNIEKLARRVGLAAEQEIKTGVVRPGDTIIVGFNRRLNMAEHNEMQNRLRVLFPDVKVIVFPEVEELRVFRPDGEGM